MTDEQHTKSFGYEDIPAGDKEARVRGVFDAVADKYDVMNDLMSAGLHRVWKAHMVAALAVPTNNRAFRLVDVAGGTGDIAFRAAALSGAGFGAEVIDINEEMLRVGQSRAEKNGYNDRVTFTAGNAEALPLKDESVDAYMIAFGIRNVTNIDKALSEAYRVLKPKGRFLCLEFSHVNLRGLDKLYDAWSFKAIPKIGQWITGDAAPYQYLVESIRRFPTAQNFADMISTAGFERARFERLTGGVAALHSGWKT